jgi:hypothetical protein
LFRRLSKIDEDSQHDALRGPARFIAFISDGNHIKHLILDSFVSFFLRFGRRDAFCTDTFLQADGVTHRNLYTEQFLRADILTQRGLCTKKNVHRCLYTLRGFYIILRKEGSIYTQMLCTKMFLRA